MTSNGPKVLLEAYRLTSKKSFGQHFMADAGIARRIAEFATTPPGGTVVEIGAGLGALTRQLVSRAAHVIAVERDRDLVPPLKEELADAVRAGKLVIVEADAKKLDYPSLLGDGATPRVIAGNLPYNLTGPLLQAATAAAEVIDYAVFLVQLEVADRLTAKPGEKNYGALTVFAGAAFEPKRAFIVRRGAFYPQPRVDSAVVVLTKRTPRLAFESEAFRTVVHAAFAQRRKTLRNAWRGILGLSVERVAAAAGRAGIDLDARGETLAVASFARMAEEVTS